MLMAVAVVEAQVPHKVTYTKEGMTRRGPAEYKIAYEFQKGTPENIREKTPIFFLQYVMQHAIKLEEENGPDIGYKIRRFPSRLHPMTLGKEEDRYEEVWEDGWLMFG